ncbi:autotransporter-associated beta strand repeat-containing protein [Pseudogulbenkiania sp. MAI-1]|uniref:autotransporter-associated beta strand repeat-containing protein n=1 Tax=Pseudogulbenkiania sp. MAI-1 TaxID=990370 RepID=UPI0004BB9E35|nr:autotransporter-associated beta strand repeat-containing protein [Pseudogulbenkiania sp. MAI-1]
MKRIDLTYRLTKVGGKVASVAVCVLTGAMMVGAAGNALATPFILQGNYIKIGVNDVGTLGSGGSTPPGILYDGTGKASFNPNYDYLTPGTPFEGFALAGTASSGGAFSTSNNNASNRAQTPFSGTLTDYSGVTFGGATYDNRAVWTGSYSLGGSILFSLTNDVYFNDTDQQVHIKSTITANQDLGGLYFGRFTDPDARAAAGDSSQTNNFLGTADVSSKDLVYAEALVSKYVIGLYSADPTNHGAGISKGWSTNPTDYFNGTNDGNGDYTIGLGFNIGSLSAGNSKTLDYSYIFGTDIAKAVVDAGAGTTKPDIDTGKAAYTTTELSSGAVNPVFDGGTLSVADSGTVVRDLSIKAAGGTIDANGNSATFSGVISDASGATGSLTLKGSGTITFSGNNSYSGATSIGSGSTLALAGAGNIAESSGVTDNGTFDISGTTAGTTIKTLSGNGSVVLGSKTLTLSSASDTFAGAIGGTGGLIISGGSETLSGNNGYSGGTSIGSGATLALAGAGDIAESSGMTDNGTFDISGTTAGTTIKTLAGNGSVVLGSKTLTLGSASDTFAGAIGGTGGLTVSGGSETLSGNNSYSGATSIGSGATLALSGAGDIAESSGVTDNGTFDISGTTAGSIIKTLAGNGSVVLGSKTLTLGSASDTFAGAIGGTGGLAVSGGTQTLSGSSDYSGGTTVSGGATVRVAADAALGAAGGGLTLNNGTLATTATHDSARTITLTGNGIIDVADATTLTENGQISGGGGLTKAGAGTLVLCGSDYTGSTTVSAGTLKACKANALAAASATTVAAGATLDLNGYDQTVGSLAGDGHVTLGSANLTTGGDNSTTFSGGITGTGSLTKTGSGTLTLSGDNDYSGATTVSGGTLKAGKAGSLASDSAITVATGATLDLNGFDQTIGSLAGAGHVTLGSAKLTTGGDNGSTTFSGDIAGTGSLSKTGSGTLTLSGSNSYSGGTTVNAGTLQVAVDSALGDASGNVTLNGGTLQTTADMSTGRKITLLADSQLLTDAGTTFTQNGGIDGSGRLFKGGDGTLVLTGNNTYSGGTTINGGVVDVALGSSLGTGTVLLNGGTLHTTQTLGANQQVLVAGKAEVNVDAGTTTTLSGTISSNSSSGCFNKTGTGTLNLTGSATMNNGTCVQDGMLRANGTLDSWVQVDAAGTLRGSGLIIGDMTVSGTLAPGNSPGLLSQVGTTTMLAGSSFQEDIDGTTIGNGAGHYSHLDITGGQFIISDNVTLAPQLRGITGSASNTFTPSVGDLFRIITADGGIVGRFATLTQPASGLAADTRFTAFYNMRGSDSVDLVLTPTSYAAYLAKGKGNVNAQSAGGVLDKLLAHQDDGSATSRQSDLLYAVAGVNGNTLPDLTRRLSGEVHGALAAAAPQAGRALQNQVAGRLRAHEAGSKDPGVEGTELGAVQDLWLDVSTNHGDFDADGYASGYRTQRDQYTVGRDLYRNGRNLFGAGFSYATNHVSANAGTGAVDDSLGFVYGQLGAGDFVLDGVAAYGTSRWKTQRTDPLQQTGSLQTTADGQEALVGVGVRLPLQLGKQTVEPFARALWQHSARKGIDEGSASEAGLSFGGYSANGTRVLAGLSGGSLSKDPLTESVTYKFSVAVGRDIGDEGRPEVNGRLAKENLTVVAPHAGRDFVQASLSGTVQLNRSAYIYAGLNGEVGKGRSEVGATAGLRIRF